MYVFLIVFQKGARNRNKEHQVLRASQLTPRRNINLVLARFSEFREHQQFIGWSANKPINQAERIPALLKFQGGGFRE